MNPLFDLIVIGVIVSMVWLNLYLSKEPSPPTISLWSAVVQKLAAFNPVGHKTALKPSSSSQN
jgi:hypothetical protein